MSDGNNKDDDSGKLLYCSFCGKSQHEVRKLIAGPSVFVCDECVDLCNDIIREEIQDKSFETEVKKLIYIEVTFFEDILADYADIRCTVRNVNCNVGGLDEKVAHAVFFIFKNKLSVVAVNFAAVISY